MFNDVLISNLEAKETYVIEVKLVRYKYRILFLKFRAQNTEVSYTVYNNGYICK